MALRSTQPESAHSRYSRRGDRSPQLSELAQFVVPEVIAQCDRAVLPLRYCYQLSQQRVAAVRAGQAKMQETFRPAVASVARFEQRPEAERFDEAAPYAAIADAALTGAEVTPLLQSVREAAIGDQEAA